MIENIPTLVSSMENLALDREVEENEVNNAIWALEPNKVPKLYGFTTQFYMYFWERIKKDLCKMIKWSLKKCKLAQ